MRDVNLELNLSSHAIKVDLKNATGADTSNFVKKSDKACLKRKINKVNIGKSMQKLILVTCYSQKLIY